MRKERICLFAKFAQPQGFRLENKIPSEERGYGKLVEDEVFKAGMYWCQSTLTSPGYAGDERTGIFLALGMLCERLPGSVNSESYQAWCSLVL